MDDNEYVRNAVELVGWKYDDSAHGHDYIGPKVLFVGLIPTPWLDSTDPVILDALAAQLVRQYYKKRPQHYPLTHESDPMVTIRDIIDSGVLITGDS